MKKAYNFLLLWQKYGRHCRLATDLCKRADCTDTLIWADHFLYDQGQPGAGEGEVAKFENSSKNTQYLMNTLYVYLSRYPTTPRYDHFHFLTLLTTLKFYSMHVKWNWTAGGSWRWSDDKRFPKSDAIVSQKQKIFLKYSVLLNKAQNCRKNRPLCETLKINDRSIEVRLCALLGKYSRQTDQPTDGRTDRVIGKLHF